MPEKYEKPRGIKKTLVAINGNLDLSAQLIEKLFQPRKQIACIDWD